VNGEVPALAAAMSAIAMVAVVALVAGGIWMIVKRRDRTRGVLMIVCAAVVLGNILIWTL